ncbi:hypothetical protein BJ170DRAFT_722807 [Xylariales sp. AK1849]|nr:hypothetical protein BJ170DRAFT_722807 [Xylariales sp. AK1849]
MSTYADALADRENNPIGPKATSASPIKSSLSETMPASSASVNTTWNSNNEIELYTYARAIELLNRHGRACETITAHAGECSISAVDEGTRSFLDSFARVLSPHKSWPQATRHVAATALRLTDSEIVVYAAKHSGLDNDDKVLGKDICKWLSKLPAETGDCNGAESSLSKPDTLNPIWRSMVNYNLPRLNKCIQRCNKTTHNAITNGLFDMIDRFDIPKAMLHLWHFAEAIRRYQNAARGEKSLRALNVVLHRAYDLSIR